MEVKITKNTLKFEPIKVAVEFSITSYDELYEFIRYSAEVGDVCQYNGDNSEILSDLMLSICEAVTEGL
jgi:hypothetical protein